MKRNKRRKKPLLPQEKISYTMDEMRGNDELGIIINSPIDFDIMYAMIESLFADNGIIFDEDIDFFEGSAKIINGIVPNITVYPEQHKVRIIENNINYFITARFATLCSLIRGEVNFKKPTE